MQSCLRGAVQWLKFKGKYPQVCFLAAFCEFTWCHGDRASKALWFVGRSTRVVCPVSLQAPSHPVKSASCQTGPTVDPRTSPF